MPTPTKNTFKEKSTKLLILLPPEPCTFELFNVRHPVDQLTSIKSHPISYGAN